MLATLRDGEDKLTTFDHDGFDRLSGSAAGGNDLIAQYDASNVLQKRFAFAPGGEPLVAYDASGTRTFLETDERGSVIALADASGANIAIDTYDEYGIPSAGNQGTFQYAGMLWLSSPGLYAPRYRSFNANQGRFNQTDPIGYAGGVNLYAYVLNDPVNLVDPFGLKCSVVGTNDKGLPIIRCDHRGDTLPPGITDYREVGGYEVVGTPIPGINDFIGIGIPGPPRVGGSGDQTTPPGPENQQQMKPQYCRSILYQLGDIADKTGSLSIKAGGLAIAAGAIQFAFAPASGGASAVSGAGFIVGGADLVQFGAALQITGKAAKWMSSGAASFNQLDMSIGLMKFTPAIVSGPSAAMAEVAASNVVPSPQGDPCGL